MQLTKLEKQAFDTFGFVMVRNFLTAENVEALRQAVTAMKCEESGEADPLEHHGRVTGMFHKHPLLLALFDDPRLDAIARELMPNAGRIRFLGDEYVSYSTPADWHPDMARDADFESLKFGFYLDDISQGGCLRVVPGSHNPAFFGDIEQFRSTGKPPTDIACAYACMTDPGDLLVFNLKLWHQGTANPPRTHRRVIFWSVGEDKPGFIEYAHSFHLRNGRENGDAPWPDSILRNAPPHRIEMLDVYQPGSAKARSLSSLCSD